MLSPWHWSRPCTVLVNDMRLRIDAADACTYPDVLVLCGEPSFHDNRKDVLTNATLLIEVLSPSTEGYDRGGKFAVYRGLPELAQYVLIAQDRFSVDVFTRQPDGRWLLEAHTDPNASLPLRTVDSALTLSDIYDKVRFDSAEADR
ncbi:Uma2 family endonuclease [Thiorhodococcus mannitoliphagus]|uniref:Uma2 family endonuclease n=1 Tax=Thiorhodococcus mannitoliphagus TaxID=329406 RepID=A0A6P1E3F7_9GAMM|nr:Uma2 family endonuclease [Thiorhodococcus mannitoliphagus]NEX23586.1 Uma2 family endonuclease [Thiorhodococcus mannitoliphagus]